MKKIILASVLLAGVATPAVAQEFAGFRAEARAGWDEVTLEAEYDDVDANDADASESGLGYGVEVGFDMQPQPGFVVGAYGGVDFSDTDYCAEVFGDDEACLETGRNYTLGVRAGAVVTPQTLLYVKGGYSNGKLKGSYVDDLDATNNYSDSATRGGWHIGAGVEQSFGRVYGKLEYVHTNYNGSDFDEDLDLAIDGSRHQVMLGLGFRI